MAGGHRRGSSAADPELLADPLPPVGVAAQHGGVHPLGQVDHGQELEPLGHVARPDQCEGPTSPSARRLTALHNSALFC